MRIANPHLLWLLLAAPAVVLAYAIAFARRRRLLNRLGEQALIARMAASVSVPRKVLAAAMVVLALAFLALALARPQAGGRARLEKQRGLDIVVALDFSKSMLAKDIYPSRLERAKREPPGNSRACARSHLMRKIQNQASPYFVDWEEVSVLNQNRALLPDPFRPCADSPGRRAE